MVHLHQRLYWWAPEPRLYRWGFPIGRCPRCSARLLAPSGARASCRKWTWAAARAAMASRGPAIPCSWGELLAGFHWSEGGRALKVRVSVSQRGNVKKKFSLFDWCANQPGRLWPRWVGWQSCRDIGLWSAWSVTCRPPSLPSSVCPASTAGISLSLPLLPGSSWRSRWTSAPTPFAKSPPELWAGAPDRRCTCSSRPSLTCWWSWHWCSPRLSQEQLELCQLEEIFTLKKNLSKRPFGFTLHTSQITPFETFLTWNNILVAVLLLVLPRLTNQTVVQRLEILKVLPGRKTEKKDARKNMYWKETNWEGIVDSYIKLLQRDLLLQKPPHHADHHVELGSRVLAIGDYFDEGQRGQLVLCDDWPVFNRGRGRRITKQIKQNYQHNSRLQK